MAAGAVLSSAQTVGFAGAFGGAMDVVLGMSMAPTAVRMVLVEGENADGVTVNDDNFDIVCDDDAATVSAADQVISTILGTRQGATQAGYALASTGVTWTDPVDAAALREALATRKIENVMLVSAFMAAAALAQMVGNATGNAHTALLFVEADTATLAVVDSGDGSITDVHKELISGVDAVADLAGMVAGLDRLDPHPQHLFLVGSGVDIAGLKAQLEAVTSLPVSAPEEPETALAWGAALASASAPLFASSTAALAYAQDPATGEVDPYAVSPGYLAVPDVPPGTELGEDDLAYSAVPDEEAEANTAVVDLTGDEHSDGSSERRPLLLVGTILAVVFVAAALALEVSLALGIRPSVALLPRPLQNLFVPTHQAPAPASAPASAPAPQVNHVQAPAVAPRPLNARVPAPPPAAPVIAPVPAAPPAPAVAPRAPVVAPRVPVLVPLPLPIPAASPAPINPFPLNPPGSPPPWHFPGWPPGHPPGSPPPWHFPGSPPPIRQPAPPVPVSGPEPPAPVHLAPPQPPVHMPAPAPAVPQAPDNDAPHAQGPWDNDAPHAQGPSDNNAPHAQGPWDNDLPHAQGPSDNDAPHAQGPSDNDLPHAQGPSDNDAPHAQGPSDNDAPHAQGPSDNSFTDDEGGDRGFGGFGGNHEGDGDLGGFGGGDHGFGGFGGGHGFGGGGFGGGGFGGGGFGGGGGGGGGGGHR
jgi:hypothetical protein